MTQETAAGTEVMATIARAVDEASVRKVFGEPIVRDDLTIIPVARVGGGGGGGGGTGTGRPAKPGEAETSGTGAGGGLGLTAKPAGVFVVKGGKVTWRPAVDINKVIMGGQVVGIVALLVFRALARARRTNPTEARGQWRATATEAVRRWRANPTETARRQRANPAEAVGRWRGKAAGRSQATPAEASGRCRGRS